MTAEPDATPFLMHGAREAAANGLAHTVEQIAAIEQAMETSPGLVFDLARTLVESTCRTVLSERGIHWGRTDDLPVLFKRVTNESGIRLLPVDGQASPEVRTSLKQTINGLNTALQGICALRNHCGFASHGADGPRPELEVGQALLAAEAADAIVGFLHRMHRASDERELTTQDREPLRDEVFDRWIDEAYGPFAIFEAEFQASDILLALESETYRVYLAEFEAYDEVDPADSEEPE